MIRQIYLQNQSTLVTADEAKLIARACDWQLRHHAGPAWERTPWRILLSNVDPSASMPLVILDDADQAGALGYHDETPDGRPYARVFVAPILSAGGNMLSGSLSVAVTASHEALESFCLVPDTRVLTADLTWVGIGELKPGNVLIGFDEHVSGGYGRASHRRYKPSIVETVKVLQRPCYELIVEDGTVLVASSDHRWLVTNGNTSHWIETKNIRVKTPGKDARGRIRSAGKISSRIIKPMNVWGPPTYEDGYIAGAFDGEGCLGSFRSSAGRGHLRLSFSQNDNAMLERTKQFLLARGIRWTTTIKKAGTGKYRSDHHVLYVSHKNDVMTILGRCRPPRLLEKFEIEGLGHFLGDVEGAPRVVEKRFVGEREVVAVQTSTRTFIAEGFASHNCDPNVQLWADDDGSVAWALEIGDPVEAQGYAVPNYAGGAWVSNFVFPAFFDSRDATGPYDQLGVLSKPFTLDDGGYAIVLKEGAVTEIFAEHAAKWRKDQTRQHPAARSHRRRLASFAAPVLMSERVTEPPGEDK